MNQNSKPLLPPGSTTRFLTAVILPCTQQFHGAHSCCLVLSTLDTCVLPGSFNWAAPRIFYLLLCLSRCCAVYARADALLRQFSAQPKAEATGQCTQLLQEFSQGKKCWAPHRDEQRLPPSPLGWWRRPDTKTFGISLKACDALCLLQLELGMMSRSKTLAQGLVALACFANRHLGRRWDTNLLVIKSGITKSENFAYCTRQSAFFPLCWCC